MKTSLSKPSSQREAEPPSQSIAFPAPQSYPTGPEAVALASYPAVQRYAVPGDAAATELASAQVPAPAVVQRRHDPRRAPLAHQPLGKDAVMQLKFKVCGITFDDPPEFKFSKKSAQKAITPLPHGSWGKLTGHPSGYGVEVGDVGSYGAIKYLEQSGDGLTGDHQPSGAAVKEAIRVALHYASTKPLTRSAARIAYDKAITIVVTDAWHKAYSRTYGGRNTKSQISGDALDLTAAAIADWEETVPGLLTAGFSKQDIIDIWDSLNAARENFFDDGEPDYVEF